MIIRRIGARHGSKAWIAPITRSCRPSERASSTSSTANNAAATQPAAPHGALPRVFSKAAKLAQARQIEAQNKYTVDKWKANQEVARLTQNIGSVVEHRYRPEVFITEPPAANEITLEMLMANQTHMGHHRSLWNPANSRYIYGIREETHIISLEETAAHLRRAAKVVEAVSHAGGLILIVGTRTGHTTLVTKAAKMAGGCHLFTKWLPGTFTNREVILADAAVKIVNEHDETIPGFDDFLQQRRPLVPDLVICLNPVENYVLLYECGLENIPTIGVIDTNADPTWVTYPIPANDDSLRSVGLIVGALGRAGQIGRERRLADAKSGHVTWETPPDFRRYVRDMLKSERGSSRRQRTRPARPAEDGDARLLGETVEKLEGEKSGNEGGAGVEGQADAPLEAKPEAQ